MKVCASAHLGKGDISENKRIKLGADKFNLYVTNQT